MAWLKKNGYDYYEPHGARGEMYYIPQISSLPAEAHPTQWIGDQSIDFIREQSADTSPWLLFSSFIHPHPPFAPPKPWHKLYREHEMPLPFVPEGSEELYTWINRFQNRYKHRDRGTDLNLLRVIKAYYYASISFVDYQVGRIAEFLEETGQLDDTLILFTSDHGEHLGDFGCFGKRSMHDASARVPMVVRYPDRFPAGSKCDAATSLCDVFPTLAAAAGVETVGLGLDGTDLAAIVADPDPERVVYSQFEYGEKAIYMAVDSRWKYVYSAGDKAEFFFDREKDPAEAVNLTADPEHQNEKNKMKMKLLKYLELSGAEEAFVKNGGLLEWREYPDLDEEYLNDPDARLLYQDYPCFETKLPGYQ